MTPATTWAGGDVVGPLGPRAEQHVAAPVSRVALRWTADLLVLLVGGVVLGFLGFGVLHETVSEAAAGAGLVGGYLLWAVAYGAVGGRVRSLGDRVAGVRRLRIRDGSPVGALRGAGRSLLAAVAWPVWVPVVVGAALTVPGWTDQGGRLARVVVVRPHGA